jgi:hypothetical protein
VRDDKYFDVFEQATNLTDYYTEQVGKTIEFGFDNEYELWVSAPRTNGREYFETYGTAEERIRLLYPDIFLDDDYGDPLADY